MPLKKTIHLPRQQFGLPMLAAILLACAGCYDDGSDNPLPVGAQINISPDTVTYDVVENRNEDGDCFLDPARTVDQPLVITVTDNQGSPIGKADLNISLDLAANNLGTLSPVDLYDDKNSNGVIDGPEERVTNENSPIFRTKTEQFTGERVVLLRLNTSCTYRGKMTVFSDGFTGFAEYEITANN